MNSHIFISGYYKSYYAYGKPYRKKVCRKVCRKVKKVRRVCVRKCRRAKQKLCRLVYKKRICKAYPYCYYKPLCKLFCLIAVYYLHKAGLFVYFPVPDSPIFELHCRSCKRLCLNAQKMKFFIKDFFSKCDQTGVSYSFL